MVEGMELIGIVLLFTVLALLAAVPLVVLLNAVDHTSGAQRASHR